VDLHDDQVGDDMGGTSSSHRVTEDGDVLILHVFPGERDIEPLL
jgi:hypothetical protein